MKKDYTEKGTSVEFKGLCNTPGEVLRFSSKEARLYNNEITKITITSIK
jgi:hypothetical protein